MDLKLNKDPCLRPISVADGGVEKTTHLQDFGN